MIKKILHLIIGVLFFLLFSFIFKVNFVGSFIELGSISDTILNSRADIGTNHRVKFRVTSDTPGGSKILFKPISRPSSHFYFSPEMDYEDVQFFVNEEEKILSNSSSENISGVNFISGENGEATITLADNLSLSNGDIVVIIIGKDDRQVINPPTNGPYRIRIDILSSTDVLLSRGEAAIFILNPVNVGAKTFVPYPIVKTNPANVIGSNEVVLRGQLLNMGPAEEVNVFFEYRKMGLETWNRTGKFGRNDIVNFSEFVGGLEAETEYEFRSAVEWEEEDELFENFGEILTFTTMDDEPEEEDELGEGLGAGSGAGLGAGTGRVDRGGGPGGPDEGIREGEPADPPPPEIQDPPPYLGLYGWAYPDGEIILIQDEKEIKRTITNHLGEFSIEINEPISGNFNYILKGKEEQGNSVSTDISFTLEMNPSRGLIIRNIMFSPIAKIDQELFLMEESVDFFGRAIPENEVYIQIIKDDTLITEETIKVDSNGNWFFSQRARSLERGRYVVKVFSLAFDEKSAPGGYLRFSVSETGCAAADIVKNERVGISDFSILMHYWGTGETRADLNSDGIVDLLDFSIMMNCWTG